MCALLHDIGDHLAPGNHSEVAAAMNQATVDFCADHDQSSFDPGYAWEPVEFFAPMDRQVLSPDHRRPLS